jgi:vacuolar-type H+-ATPase subunit H
MGALPWTLRTSGAVKEETLTVSTSESSPLPKSVKTTIENYHIRRGSLDDIHKKSNLKNTLNIESIKNINTKETPSVPKEELEHKTEEALENNETLENETEEETFMESNEVLDNNTEEAPSQNNTVVKEQETEENHDLDTTTSTTTATNLTS